MAQIPYKKLLGLVSATALLLLAGCAAAPEHQAAGTEAGKAAAASQGQSSRGEAKQASQTAPAASGGKGAAKAAARAEAAPATPDIPGSDVISLEQKMKLFPRVLWHSHTNTYRFYVGTVLFAEYNPFTDTFTVMTDNANLKNLVCTYTPTKGWQVKGSAKGQTCNSLLKTMNDYLTHPYS